MVEAIEHADVIAGSRLAPGADVGRAQPLRRRLVGWPFIALTRGLLGEPTRDVYCGFKLWRGVAAQAVFSRQRLDGWVFDAEVLALARRLGYRVREVGITWTNREASKLSIFQTLMPALRELLAARRNVRVQARARSSGRGGARGRVPRVQRLAGDAAVVRGPPGRERRPHICLPVARVRGSRPPARLGARPARTCSGAGRPGPRRRRTGCAGAGPTSSWPTPWRSSSPFFEYTRDAPARRAALEPPCDGRPSVPGQRPVGHLLALHWPAYVLPLWKALAVMALLKLFVAAFGTFLLGRRLGMRFGGALVAGLVFAFGTFFVVWLAWPLTNIFPLMPWLLLLTELLVRRPCALQRRRAGGAGGARVLRRPPGDQLPRGGGRPRASSRSGWCRVAGVGARARGAGAACAGIRGRGRLGRRAGRADAACRCSSCSSTPATTSAGSNGRPDTHWPSTWGRCSSSTTGAVQRRPRSLPTW